MFKRKSPSECVIGVISDTHGLLRPEVETALGNSDLIIHAGDVGNPLILEQLKRIAPVVAVRGNCDRDTWAEGLPPTEAFEIKDLYLYLLHDLNALDIEPSSAGFSAVIFGHSHLPFIDERNDVLFFNPGSCGPKRWDYPVSMGRIIIEDGHLTPEIIYLAQD